MGLYFNRFRIFPICGYFDERSLICDYLIEHPYDKMFYKPYKQDRISSPTGKNEVIEMIRPSVVRQSHNYYYKKHSKEIKRIKTIEQIEIITKKVENAFETHRISYEECEDLMTRLSSKASNIGEKKRVLKLGPLGEFGGEKKGAI